MPHHYLNQAPYLRTIYLECLHHVGTKNQVEYDATAWRATSSTTTSSTTTSSTMTRIKILIWKMLSDCVVRVKCTGTKSYVSPFPHSLQPDRIEKCMEEYAELNTLSVNQTN